MTAIGFDQFENGATEARFRLAERASRVRHVRVYAILAGLVILVYGIINPIFFSHEDELQFNMLLVPTLLVLGGYCAATFWSKYAEVPMIDFTCLMGFALLVMVDNMLIYDEMQRIDAHLHAIVAINGLIVTAFAAIAFAGQLRWFAAWALTHATAYSIVLVSVDRTTMPLTYAAVSYLTGMAVMLFINWALGRAHRHAFALGEALEAERAKSEELLYNVLPPVAAERLKAGQVVADSFSDASVVFIDVVGFSVLSRRVSPGHLIDVLNAFFSLADRCAAQTGVEKVKTIGDAYLAISGGNSPSANSADAAIRFGQAVIGGLEAVRRSTGIDLQVRVGIHSGPVVGGVIGETRMAYDYWGETMNIASRIESAASVGGIAVSEATYMRARTQYTFSEPVLLPLKGVGDTYVYRVQFEAEAPQLALAG